MHCQQLVAVALCLVVPVGAARAQPDVEAPRPLGLTLDTEFANARILSAREGTILDPREILVVGYGVSYQPGGRRLGAGLRVRGSTQEGDFGYGDFSMTYALAATTLEAGVAWRRGYDLSTGLVHGAVHRVGRAGVRFRQPIDATPLTVQWRAGLYVPLTAGTGAAEPARGWELESALLYDWSRSPVTLRLGFRFERFRVYRMEQEVGMVQFAVTWRGMGAL